MIINKDEVMSGILQIGDNAYPLKRYLSLKKK
jgi:hypothetical protein